MTRHFSQTFQVCSRSSVSSAATSVKKDGCSTTSSAMCRSSMSAPAMNVRQCSAGTAGGEVGQRHQVVHQPQVPGLDLVPVAGRDVGLQLDDPLGLGAPGSRPRRSRASGRCGRGRPRGSRRTRPPGSTPRRAVRVRSGRRTSRTGSGSPGSDSVSTPTRPRTPTRARDAHQLDQLGDLGDRVDRRRSSSLSGCAPAASIASRVHEAGVQIGDLGLVAAVRRGRCRSIPVMMSRTASSAASRRTMKEPVNGLSSGIVVCSIQVPLTCR